LTPQRVDCVKGKHYNANPATYWLGFFSSCEEFVNHPSSPFFGDHHLSFRHLRFNLWKGGVLLACLVASLSAAAQELEELRRPEVESVEFAGTSFMNDGELAKLLVTKESPGFLSRILGADPQYFDRAAFDEDIERLRVAYFDKGFFDVVVDTQSVQEDEDVSVRFIVDEGIRYEIDSVAYEGFWYLPDYVLVHFTDGRMISSGEPFDQKLLEREAERIVSVARNHGFGKAIFLNDSSRTFISRSTHSCTVKLGFDLKYHYTWGDVDIRQNLEAGKSERREDITDDIVVTQLHYEAGEPYSAERVLQSERDLNRLGIFDRAGINVNFVDGGDSSFLVHSLVTFTPRDKHELAPELLISDENSVFNFGIGMGYTNRNFLGGARIFSTRLRFRTQTISQFPLYFGTGIETVSNLDLTFELQQPYIFSNNVRGIWSFAFIKDKQKLYREDIIRNRFSFVNQFAEFTTGILEWTIESSQTRLNDGVTDTSVVRTQAEPQLNSILSFTIQRDKSFPAFVPVRGFIHTLSVDESGILPVLFEKSLRDRLFTQFFRFIAVGRWYTDVSDYGLAIFATKLKFGIEDKYGKSKSDPRRQIPPTYRFYAGGGGSIRGWPARELIASGNPNFGGNVSFEGSLELRVNTFRRLHNSLLDPIWFVGFVDYGNVWQRFTDLRLDQMAVAFGAGIRYDTFFGPFRLDIGWRLYDPAEAGNSKWITHRPFFKNLAFHFGIGHAF